MPVNHTRDDHRIANHCEVQGVRESWHQGPPLLAVNEWEGQRLLTNPGQYLIERRTKLSSQSRSPVFVPPLGLEQLALGLRPENDRPDH